MKFIVKTSLSTFIINYIRSELHLMCLRCELALISFRRFAANINIPFKDVVFTSALIILAVTCTNLYFKLEDSELQRKLDTEAASVTYASMACEISQLADTQVEHAEAMSDIQEYAETQVDRLNDNFNQMQQMQSDIERLNEYIPTPTPTPAPIVSVTDSEIRDIAALVYLEAGSQSYSCQQAIASVIINRMLKYNKSALSVIYEPGVFSPASRVRYTTPSQSCMNAVISVINDGPTLPRNVLAFRNGHYHNFGTPYVCIDGVYFTKMG
jgi:hypothetical protein